MKKILGKVLASVGVLSLTVSLASISVLAAPQYHYEEKDGVTEAVVVENETEDILKNNISDVEESFDEAVLGTEEIPFSFDSKTGKITFTQKKGAYYVLRIKYPNGSENQPWWFGDYDSPEHSTNIADCFYESGKHILQIVAYENEEKAKKKENPTRLSKEITFTYNKPQERIATPSRPTLKLQSNGSSQRIEANWGTVNHALEYQFITYKDKNYNSRSWYNLKTNTGTFYINSSDYGHTFEFVVVAKSDDISKYLESKESEKSEIVYIDEKGNVTIGGQPTEVKPNGIGLNYDSMTLEKGTNRFVSATVVPDNATDKSLTWSSSNTNVATVVNGENGATISAKNPGTALITAKTVNGLTATCTVKVIVNPTKITLNKTSATMYIGEEMTLTPTLAPTDVSEKTIKWTVSNPSIASVNNGKVKVWGAGNIKVTAKTVNGLTATCDIIALAENNPSNPFADVKSGDWKYNAAMYVYEKGYMNGKGMLAGKVLFSPDTSINRSMFVQTLYNVEGKPSVKYVQKFSDVSEGAWYAKPVTWAEKNGIVAGNADGTFGVNGAATREQLAQMFYKYAVYKGYDTKIKSGSEKSVSDFPDADSVSGWAVNSLNWALSRGIMSGKGSGKLDPKGKATRVECATMLRNFMNAYSGEVPKLTSSPELLDEDLLSDELSEEESILPEDVIEKDIQEEKITSEEKEIKAEKDIEEEDIEEEDIEEEEIKEEKETKEEEIKDSNTEVEIQNYDDDLEEEDISEEDSEVMNEVTDSSEI